MLKLIELLEKGDFESVETVLNMLPGLDAVILNEAQMAATRWVRSLSDTA